MGRFALRASAPHHGPAGALVTLVVGVLPGGAAALAGTGDDRVEALRLADVFRAQVVDTTTSSFIFELTGSPDKIDNFIILMRELGLVEVGRTGIVGMMRGASGT